MCGIAGAVGGRGLNQEQWTALGFEMTRALRHRGPDANGVALVGQNGVFAHTRLKIIDLSERARQPFLSPDGQVSLTFNGEIYNYLELRRLLEQRGVRFVSDSDTEVIVQQYLQYGAAGLDALDGMFAFAIYDARDHSVLLMRDRLGKKPLFYTLASDGCLVFASEIKALLHPELTLQRDPSALPGYLAFGYVETPRTFFRSVNKLPPATRLVRYGDGPLDLKTYWRLEPSPQPWSLDLQETKAAVREAVSLAVRRRLLADVPLGAFLSGGVDSSIIVAEMADRARAPKTFAVGFDALPSFDERQYARLVAQRFGADHTELVVSSSPEGLMESLLWHHDEPYGDSSALALYAVAKATRQHVTVALSGDGGDEVFAGYTRFRGGLLAGVVPGPLGQWAHRALSFVPEPRGYKNPVSLARRFLEHAGRTGDEQLLAWNSFFAGPALHNLLRPELMGPSFDPWSVYQDQLTIFDRARRQGRDRLDQILRHNLATYLLDDLLVKADRMTMAVALEARSPFLDTQLVELAFRIPSSIKLRHGQLKWLLRESYRSVLPAEILDRKKHGFGVPLSAWWSGPLRGQMQSLLGDPQARLGDYLQLQAVRTLVDEHLSGRRDHGQRIFLLVQLELWLRGSARPFSAVD